MVLLSDGCKSDREFWRLCSAICTRNRPGANGRASVLIHPAVEAHLTLFGRRRRLTVRRRTVPVPATEGCGGFSSASASYQWNTGRSTPNSTKEYWSTGVTFPSWCPWLELGGSSSEREGSSVDLSPPPLLPAKDIGLSVDVPEATESSVDPEGKSTLMEEKKKSLDRTFFFRPPGTTRGYSRETRFRICQRLDSLHLSIVRVQHRVQV